VQAPFAITDELAPIHTAIEGRIRFAGSFYGAHDAVCAAERAKNTLRAPGCPWLIRHAAIHQGWFMWPVGCAPEADVRCLPESGREWAQDHSGRSRPTPDAQNARLRASGSRLVTGPGPPPRPLQNS
jgi:hypothetical protein